MKNYTVFHLHSDYSSGSTNIDSVTKYYQYIEKAKELGMKSLAFSEHGNCFNWYSKKTSIEKAGIKYIHAVEMYVSENPQEKVRDNYHIILIAKNYDGFLELNELVSKGYNKNGINVCDDKDRFYYNSRVSLDEVINTSDNIIISTACLGGILYKGNEKIKNKFITFLEKNKHRCYLEIQPHNCKEQISYNKYLYMLSTKTNIPLIASGDFHSLNEKHAELRLILQKAKNVYFEGEDDFNLIFKNYDQFVESFKKQDSLPENIYLKAIENTNDMASKIEEFKIDLSPKYPKMYKDSKKVFINKVKKLAEENIYVNNRYNKETINNRIALEIEIYEECGVIDFILFEEYLRKFELKNNIYRGAGRGSIGGSFIAYLLGITEVDPLKFDLSIHRFLNPARISNADIDVDYGKNDREIVKKHLFQKEGLYTSEIIAYNTIAIKGALRDVGRALDIPLDIINYICKNIENEDEINNYKKQYTDLFEYARELTGVIVSLSIHPAGILVSDLNIHKTIGTITTGTSNYRIACCDMKDIDNMMYVKLDRLGLDNVALINEVCKIVKIDKITPDNINLDDQNVWNDILKSQTCIFQFESPMAKKYMKDFLTQNNFNIFNKNKKTTKLNMLAILNGILRPGADSFRDNMINGIEYNHNFKELNYFLGDTIGYIVFQEQTSYWLKEFCGYSEGEADVVRKAIGKKGDTSKLVDEIEERFISFSCKKYGLSLKNAETIIKPFIQIILDSSRYSFNKSHAIAYSFIAYANGYLRYYYPLEFITCALNIWSDNLEKSSEIKELAKFYDIEIKPIEFKKSKSECFFDKKQNCIYKGTSSIKTIGGNIGDELFKLKKHKSFINLLSEIKSKKIINKTQLKILTKLDYFKTYGKSPGLLVLIEKYYDNIKQTNQYNGQISLFEVNDFSNIIDANILREEKEILEKYDYDISLKERLMLEYEYYNYIQTVSNKDEYINRLFICDVIPKYSKKTEKIWGYELKTYRITNGKIGSLVVYAKDYLLNPIYKYNIIQHGNAKCDKYGWKLLSWCVLN